MPSSRCIVQRWGCDQWLIHLIVVIVLSGDMTWARHRAWSIGNFGTNSERGGTGPLRHMIKEAQEVIDVIEMGGEDIDYDALAEEMGDIMFLFLDTMYRTKLPCEMLVSAMEQKMPILELRNYPKTADGVPSEHVKGEDE